MRRVKKRSLDSTFVLSSEDEDSPRKKGNNKGKKGRTTRRRKQEATQEEEFGQSPPSSPASDHGTTTSTSTSLTSAAHDDSLDAGHEEALTTSRPGHHVIPPVFAGMLASLITDEDYDLWQRMLGDLQARGREPSPAVYEAVWAAMAQGDAGPLAQRMYAEINQARKLSGPRKREWPPAHDPVTRRDLTRYLELFSIVFDTLHFQASSVSHIVLPANAQLLFIRLIHSMLKDDIRYCKSIGRIQESSFYRMLKSEAHKGDEIALRHDLLRIAFELLDEVKPDVPTETVRDIKRTAFSVFYLLGKAYLGSEESWNRDWDLIRDLADRVKDLPHTSLHGRRLRKEVAARMLEDMFSVAKVSKQHLKLRLEPISAEKIVHYYLHLIPKGKANRRRRSSSSSSSEIDSMAQREVEELFLVLLSHLVMDHFGGGGDDDDDDSGKRERKEEEALASAREVGLDDELDGFIEATRKRNVFLVETSAVLRFHISALEFFCARLKRADPLLPALGAGKTRSEGEGEGGEEDSLLPASEREGEGGGGKEEGDDPLLSMLHEEPFS